MKKLLTLFLAGIMGVSLVGCNSSDEKDELVIATVELSGDFIDGFGNSSYDNDIKNIIHGYETYTYDEAGTWVPNQTILDKYERIEDPATKNITYTFKIKDGLKWSDGKPLSVDDYIFSVLFVASDEWFGVGSADTSYDQYLGYADYHMGKSTMEAGGVQNTIYKQESDKLIREANEAMGIKYDKEGFELDADGNKVILSEGILEGKGDNGTFQGIHKLNDSEFSITIDGANLPYFYEEYLAQVYPKPMHVYAGKDAKIESSDAGAKVVGVDLADAAANVKANYRKAPSVSSGPYTFESYKNKIVNLKLNKHNIGDFRGNKATIEKIVIKEISLTKQVDALIAGDVDMVTGVIEKKEIEKVNEEGDRFKTTAFVRNGYGTMPFTTDFGATKDVHVRRAMSYLLDKNALINEALGGSGTVVAADYGKSQWMYKLKKDEIDTLNFYAYNDKKANEELDQSEWIFEADGVTPFDITKAKEKSKYYRYNANKEVLKINHMGSENNPVTDNIELQLMKNTQKAGIKFSLEKADFSALIDNFYQGAKMDPKDRKFNEFNMSINFGAVYDPYYSSYHGSFAGTAANPTNINDPELNALIESMRKTPSIDKEGYANLWLAYQKRFNEILPVVPIYANKFSDIYISELEGVNTNSLETYGQIICQLKWKK